MPSLWDEFNKAGKLVTETIVVSVYGDTVQQIVPDPHWRANYADYLAKIAIENHDETNA